MTDIIARANALLSDLILDHADARRDVLLQAAAETRTAAIKAEHR